MTGVCDDPYHFYKCPDGSCSDRMTNCPTSPVCPEERKIRCSDGNCRSSRAQCEKDTNCPKEMRLCPSGACVKKKEKCGTQITCPSVAPYKCWDQTCKQNPLDCPVIPECTHPLSRIQCPDGSCVRSRELCKEILDECKSPERHVRCPDMSCKKDVSECGL